VERKKCSAQFAPESRCALERRAGGQVFLIRMANAELQIVRRGKERKGLRGGKPVPQVLRTGAQVALNVGRPAKIAPQSIRVLTGGSKNRGPEGGEGHHVLGAAGAFACSRQERSTGAWGGRYPPLR